MFIVIEGIDGSGKTTLARNLVRHLKLRKGISAIYTREPGGCSDAEVLRKMALETSDPRTQLFLMLAARAQHVEQFITPMLSQGKTIICDRYMASTYAYQCRSDERLVPIVDSSASLFPKPDITLFLDIDPDVALERILARSRLTQFERNLHDTRTAFLQVVNTLDNSKQIKIEPSMTPLDILSLALEKLNEIQVHRER